MSFAYPDNDRKILNELDLELPAGTSTAIVGLNGAGKTTLVKLLSRIYEPTGGRITADGIPLAEFGARSWQKRLEVIYQDFVRYELDAAANIGLGAPELMGDTAALEQAVEWAGVAAAAGGQPREAADGAEPREVPAREVLHADRFAVDEHGEVQPPRIRAHAAAAGRRIRFSVAVSCPSSEPADNSEGSDLACASRRRTSSRFQVANSRSTGTRSSGLVQPGR